MAKYWAWEQSIQGDGSGVVSFQMECYYMGSDVRDTLFAAYPIAQIDIVNDNAAQIQTKLVDAIVATAVRVPNSSGGVGVSVVRNQGIIPSVNRGA